MSHWLLKRLLSYAEQTAISNGVESCSYKVLLEKVNQYRDFLEQSFSPGQRIIIKSDYSVESIALFVAFSLSRQVAIPVISHNNELEGKIRASGAEAILSINPSGIVVEKCALNKKDNLLFEDIIENQHSGLILFSSGSTGEPKAMLHDLSVLLDSYKNKRAKKLSIMVFLMFDHIGGINTLFNVLSMGAKAVIPENRNPETIARIIEIEGVNILPTSPTFLNMLLLSDALKKYNMNSIRMITYGTEPMPETLLLRVKKQFPKVKLLQTFGTSETGITQISSRSSTSLDIKIEDPDLEYKIVDGELWIKSKTQIAGYLNTSMENFSTDGWFKTGDLIEERDDGYIKIIGRKTDIINVGGEKVSPVEVESCLMTIDGVADCVVFGESNSLTGQNVSAYIVKQPGVVDKTLKNIIRKECIKKLDRYKVPTKIVFKDSISYSIRFKKSRQLSETESQQSDKLS